MERQELSSLAADVLLRDGGIAVIRPLVSEDLDEVRELHARASDDAIRLRFFSLSRLRNSSQPTKNGSFSGTSEL